MNKLNPYTGNQIHLAVFLRKELNGHSFPWKVVSWECQECYYTLICPAWCCPKCGGMAKYLTENGYDEYRKEVARKQKEERHSS